MIVALPYCHKDICQTLKLMGWIKELTTKVESSMTWAGYKDVSLKRTTLLLIPSQHAAKKELSAAIAVNAMDVFAFVDIFTPKEECEIGWPGSANFMFREALLRVEREYEDDMLFLEPDAIPLTPLWFYRLKYEWDHRPDGKEFMGAWMRTGMSGVGVYGKNWRQFAPILAKPIDDEQTYRHGWDYYGTPQVCPNAHFTKLIRHVFPNPHIAGLNMLGQHEVIFHQDKNGTLIDLMRGTPLTIEDNNSMPEKYYFAQNSNRVIKGAGYEFLFSPVDTLGGITRGVYATTNESEQIALASIVSRSGGDIFELEKEDYDNRVKKKAPELQNSKVLLPKANPMVAMSSPQGVVVENPVAHETETIPGPIVESIDSVLKTGPVKAFDPGPLKKKAKGKK